MSDIFPISYSVTLCIYLYFSSSKKKKVAKVVIVGIWEMRDAGCITCETAIDNFHYGHNNCSFVRHYSTFMSNIDACCMAGLWILFALTWPEVINFKSLRSLAPSQQLNDLLLE